MGTIATVSGGRNQNMTLSTSAFSTCRPKGGAKRLGLGGQRAIVSQYLRQDDPLLIEYTNIKSRRKSGRTR